MFLQEMHEHRIASASLQKAKNRDKNNIVGEDDNILDDSMRDGEKQEENEERKNNDGSISDDESREERDKRTAFFLEELRQTIIEKEKTISEFKREL